MDADQLQHLERVEALSAAGAFFGAHRALATFEESLSAEARRPVLHAQLARLRGAIDCCDAAQVASAAADLRSLMHGLSCQRGP